mmetsp:Transcript_111/g.315  ORF Transcript_111/g.315 Transcript_111/m.315 type:complete len:380 (-) Transcript_111:123-1262(-)
MAAPAAAAMEEASEAAPSPFDRLFLNIKSLQGGQGDSAQEPKAQGSGSSSSWGSWAEKTRKSVVEKARKAAYEVIPQASTPDAPSASEPEALEQGEAQPDIASWAKKAAMKMKKQVAEATKETRQGVASHLEKAKSVEWGEQAKNLQGGFSRSLGKVADGANQVTSGLSEKGKKAQQMAKDIQGKSQQRLSEAKAAGAAKAQQAKQKAAAAAGSVKAAAVAGAGKVSSGISGLSALALSPAKLAQFGGVFFVGVFLISMSVSFLPMLPVAPQKFALLFAFGSMTLLSSFAILKGPKAFGESLIQRKKLPFSVAYVVGLVGTLAATIVMKSYMLTAVFGVLQAISLLYFLASYVPGGQALLNFCGRLGGRAARAVCRQAT